MFQTVFVPRSILRFRWPSLRRWPRRGDTSDHALCQFVDCDADAASGEGRALCSLHRSFVEELESHSDGSSSFAASMRRWLVADEY